MRWGIALGLLLVCLAGRVAWAEDAATTAAREHSQKGITYYKLTKYDDAIREFEAAYEAKADAALLYNLAQCHRLAGHDNDALRLYRSYLHDAPRGPYHADAEDKIKALEKSLADKAAAAPPVTPTPVPEAPPPTVEPAPPPVVVTPPQAGPGPAVTQPLMPAQPMPPGPGELPPSVAPGPPPAPAQPPPAAHSGRRTAGVVLAAVGGAFLIGGAVCGLAAKADAKKVEDAASNHEQFDPSVEKAGRAAELLQWIGYGVGAASAAVGLILYSTAHASSEAPQPGRVALAPLAGPGLGGASMRVAF